ncbi:hypothetical protein D3C81_1347590 [compost metagenome]
MAVHEQLLDSHLIERQRTRLIGADNLGTPQCLHRRKLADNCLALGHPLYTKGQNNRHNRRQAFRNRRYSQ